MNKLNIPTGGGAANGKDDARLAGTNWDEPVVRVRRSGTLSSSRIRKKVLTRGVYRIPFYRATQQEIIKYLRRGYEVRLTDGGESDAIRLFPCMDKNLSSMYVSAQTMGDFRKCIGDKKVKIVHGEKEISKCDAAKMDQEVSEAHEEIKQRLAVTPDTVVTCPKCGTEFRVGKQLG